jgi:uncharacterized protein (TIGR02594 family)
MTKTMSAPGYAVVESFEGRSLVAYRDEVGVWTIGFGNTNDEADVLGFTIKAGVTITAAQASQLLRAAMVRKYDPAVNAHMGPNVTQPAFDAGDGFHYNTGAIGRASWVKSYVAGDLTAVHSQIMQWNKAGGNVLAGLTRRRNREWEMISAGNYGPEGANAARDINTGQPVGSSPASPAQPEATKAESPSTTRTPAPTLSMPPWLERMEAILGLYEFPGGADNPCILAMASQCRGNIAKTYKHDSTAWCALTVNYCLVTTGFRGDDSLWALDFRTVGAKLAGPAVGAIATKTRDGGGHVFLVRGRTADGKLIGTGGNQSDMVCDELFDPSILQFNWPAGYPVPAKVGMDTLPIHSAAPRAHKEFTSLPAIVDHPAVAPAQPLPSMLHKGDTGTAVAALQSDLRILGYTIPAAEDGTFGPATDKAIRAFQKSHPQLEVTGNDDPATQAAMNRDAQLKSAVKKTAAGGTVAGGGTGAAHTAIGAMHWAIYGGIALVVVGLMCYIAWTYRDEIRALLARQGGKA